MNASRAPQADRALELTPDGVLMAIDGRVVLANAAAYRMLGRAPGTLLGLDLEAILGPQGQERLATRLRLLDAGWTLPETSRLAFVGPKGAEEILADCRLSRFTPDEGGAGLIFSLREATEAARAEALVTRLAGLASQGFGLSGMKDFLEAATPILDGLGWRAGFIECRPEGARLMHLLAEPHPGHPVAEFGRRIQEMGPVPWEDVPVVRSVYEKGEALFLDDVPSQLASTPGHAAGFAASMAAGGFTRGAWVPIRHEGAVSHVLIVVGTDLTEHDFAGIQLFAAQISAALGLEALQNQLVRRERLAAVGEMAAVLAHEVRNPLAVIFNAVVGMRKMTGDQDGVTTLLDVVHEEADRLKRVVRDLLDFARPVVPEIQPSMLPVVVAEALESLRNEEVGLEVKVSLDLADDLPPVAADPHLLRRALVNVLDNAFLATPPDGRVDVRGERVDSGRIRLQVRNDGEPLAPEIAARVFEPFFTNRATGTGLGLTVVRRIVEDLKGEVTFDPDEKGVSFSIWLPEFCEDDVKEGTG